MNEEAQVPEESQPQLSTPERFNELYPGGKMRELTYEEVPPPVMEKFESWSQLYISASDYTPRNFTGLYILDHENDDHTYIAELQRKYSDDEDTGKPVTFIETKFVDMRGNTEIGRGEIRRATGEHPTHEGRPYVGFVGAENADFERQGLGSRRINAMNAFAQSQYGEPLFSGETITREGHGMFQKMVEAGDAEQITGDSTKPPTISYRMLKIVPKEK